MELSCIIACSFIPRAITGTDTALEKTLKLQWNYVPGEKKKISCQNYHALGLTITNKEKRWFSDSN